MFLAMQTEPSELASARPGAIDLVVYMVFDRQVHQ
jgi:hypothetical protein